MRHFFLGKNSSLLLQSHIWCQQELQLHVLCFSMKCTVCHQSNQGKWNAWWQLRHKIDLPDNYSNSEHMDHYTSTLHCQNMLRKKGSLSVPWKLLLHNYFNLSYLFLFSEFCFHLFVTRLILSNAMSSYKIAADISQLWILFASFLYQSKNIIYIWKLSIAERKKIKLLFLRVPLKWKYMYFWPTCLTKWSWFFFFNQLNSHHYHSSLHRSVCEPIDEWNGHSTSNFLIWQW